MLGPVMVDVAGLTLDATDRKFLVCPLIGGVILFARNFSSRGQLIELVAEIKSLRDPPLVVAVDQEGGRVQRFRDGFTRLPALATLGERYDTDPRQALGLSQQHGWLMAAELRACGIDLSFAPVLDLRSSGSPVIGERAFHRRPEVVIELAQAMIRGMAQAGMSAVGKHFPGHGSVVGDSHFELPVDKRSQAQLEEADLRVFAWFARQGLPGMMTAHVLYPQVHPLAAGFSPYWVTDLLRGEYGYQGAVFSDDLTMAGAEGMGEIGDRAAASLAAGCDVLLVCNDRRAASDCVAAVERYGSGKAFNRLASFAGKGRAAHWSELTQSARWSSARESLAAVRAQS